MAIVHYMILIHAMAIMIDDEKGTDTWDGPNSETFAAQRRCITSIGYSGWC